MGADPGEFLVQGANGSLRGARVTKQGLTAVVIHFFKLAVDPSRLWWSRVMLG